jgi:hypothetical protein
MAMLVEHPYQFQPFAGRAFNEGNAPVRIGPISSLQVARQFLQFEQKTAPLKAVGLAVR